MMSNYLIALAIAGVMSVPAAAQSTQSAQPGQTAANQAQPAPPQMVKKTVCEDNDNPYSHINRICHTVMVPAKPAGAATNNQQPQGAPQMDSGN
jgi:hypothetical protein